MAYKSVAPETTKQLPEDYVELVKRVHESGGYGSRGYDFSLLIYFFHYYVNDLFSHTNMKYLFSRYGYEWKREEANKNLLRTHTTAISSRMLYALAQVLMHSKFLTYPSS